MVLCEFVPERRFISSGCSFKFCFRGLVRIENYGFAFSSPVHCDVIREFILFLLHCFHFVSKVSIVPRVLLEIQIIA